MFYEVCCSVSELDAEAGLAQVPILFNLSEPQRFQLAQCMKPRTFEADELVFRKGDQGEHSLHL